MTVGLCKFFELHYHLILGQTKAVPQSTEAVLSHTVSEWTSTPVEALRFMNTEQWVK